MAQPLSRLRADLDFMPSPLPDRPGLLIRDSFQYSDTTLIIPPALVECLHCFDGRQTDLELRETLVRLTGDLQVGDLQQRLVEALSHAGFLEDEVYRQLREECHRSFREAPTRQPAHFGSAYPEDPNTLGSRLQQYMNDGQPPAAEGGLAGIAAPHVTPEGGWQSYQAAYGVMGHQYKDRTFVILGTSHYGEPERFGLTRKPFVTPLGEAVTDVALVNRLADDGGPIVKMEDYCHAVEHSIEFQVIFLQHLYGAGIRILPVLCGPYAHSIYTGARPEHDENVRRFLGALGELAAREGNRLFWVLGVDMAHMGRRYGDPFVARAKRDEMEAVAARDHDRIERVVGGDSCGFWERIQEGQNDLKWCGASPIYTFLKVVPQAKGRLLRYDQWNIDEQSVVSFGALAFRG
jgi:AmmeMemoRadiSam system protein B